VLVATLGALLADLGPLLRCSRSLFGRFWPLLDRYCLFFGGSWPLLGRPWPLLSRSCDTLGPLLAFLGALLASLGVVLGPSWTLLGRSWLLLGHQNYPNMCFPNNTYAVPQSLWATKPPSRVGERREAQTNFYIGLSLVRPYIGLYFLLANATPPRVDGPSVLGRP